MRAEINWDGELVIYVQSPAEKLALDVWKTTGKEFIVEQDKAPPPQPVAPQYVQTGLTGLPQPQGEIITYKGEQRLRSSMTEKEMEYYLNPNVLMNRGASPEAIAHHASDDSVVKIPAHLQGDDSLIGLTIESSNDNGETGDNNDGQD